MSTVLKCLKRGTQFLKSAGVPEAALSAELLLSHLLQAPRFSLHLDSDRAVEGPLVEKFETLLGKRAGRYPIQYLVREVGFRNVSLEVGEGCLIPRPETETLVQVVLERIGNIQEELNLLDIGTGSGNIAVSIAKERPWKVTATDVSQKALYYGRKNADRNQVADQISFVETDLCKGLEFGRFDAIISNPPYLSHHELALLQPEVGFEPLLALRGGEDGLYFFRRIAAEAVLVLKKNGFIFFEVGIGQTEAVRKVLETHGFHSIEISKDDAGIDRIVSGVLN